MRQEKVASVDQVQIEQKLIKLQETLTPYAPQNKYNIDKLGLYQKASSDRTLANEKVSKKKKKKTYINENI